MMSRKIIFIMLILLAPMWCMARGYAQAYGRAVSEVEGVIPFCVLQDPANVYASMHSNGVVMAQLPAGTKVHVVDHKKDGWNLVSYDMERLQYQGDVLANPYLYNTGLKYHDVYFTVAATRAPAGSTIEDGYGGDITVTAAAGDGYVLASYTQKVLGYVDYPVLKARETRSLANADLLLAVSFEPEFCGPVYEYTWAWDGYNEQFMPLPPVKRHSEPEPPWYIESLTFTDWPDLIVKTLLYADELDEDYNPVNPQFATQVYVWDGAQAVLQTQSAVFVDWDKEPMAP